MSRRIAPLTPVQAQHTLAQRLTGRVDRLRQLNTRFGLRARRVFLVHVGWNGERAGEGEPRILNRVELLPTPRVSDATAVNQRSWSAGTLPEGTIRVDQISARAYTLDMLTGVRFAPDYSAGVVHQSTDIVDGSSLEPSLSRIDDFYYEIVEDGRGDPLAYRERFRLQGQPWRMEGNFGFGVLLEASSEPARRDGLLDNQDDDL